MVKRKFLFLCLLLVLLSIAGVSAGDADDIAVQAGNDTLDDVIAVDEVDSQDKLAVSDDENTVLGLAFKDLQKLVDGAPEGSEISLDYDYYVASGGHNIKISKSITINGNNHYLDASEDGRIATIEADGKSVVFKNIKFVNGYVSDSGGAIYNGHSSTSLTFINCSFNNNKAKVDGGAIYSEGEIKISDSNFTNNQAYNTDLLAKRCFGGAIRSVGLITVENSRFEDNTAYNWGGAIYADNEIRITGSTFTGNSAKEAGAVYAGTISQPVSKSVFRSNKVSDGDGSAINIYNECSPEFVSCTFENNGVYNYGGAIYMHSSKSHLKVSNCKFNNNNYMGYGYGLGGAIYTAGEISINCSSFINNSGCAGGGAVYAETISTVSNSIFIGNKAVATDKYSPRDQDGGAIYIKSECSPEFVSCRFEGNIADNRGGAIYLDSGDSQLRVSYCTFIDNHAYKKHYNRKYNCLPGNIIFNSGHYNLMDMCWFGTNNPDFNEQLTKYYSGDDDNNYIPSNYLKIGIKINETSVYVGNNYEVTVYFYDCNGNGLEKDLLHSSGRFYGNVNFTNLKVDSCNEMTADVNITKENILIIGELDHQNVTLNLTASNKPPSNITIESLSIENVHGIYVLCEINPIPFSSSSLYYVIVNSEGDIVRQGGMSKHDTGDRFTNKFHFWAWDLPFGSYSVTVINPETRWYLASNDTRSFMIIQDVSANITADNVVYGNATTITLKADYDGLYLVSINDLVIEMNATNGSCTKQVKLNAGEYETHTKCTADHVELSCSEASFNVSKAIPLFNLNVSPDKFIYGDEISVSPVLPSDATGNITYSLNNEMHVNLAINESLKLTLELGSHLIKATYSGDSNYYSTDTSKTIKINLAKNNVSVSATNVTYGEDAVISISADVDGVYAVDVNGTIYNVTVNNGVGNRAIALNAGSYYANATFNNKNYNTTYRNAVFSVYKADVELNITVLDEVYPQDVEGVVHASRDGKYNLTIGDYKEVIVVKDGVCYFNIGTLDAGSYEAIVSLNDDNYNPVSNRTKFVVNASGTLFEIEVNASEITYGESVTVTHTINDGATGNITYLLGDGTLLGVLQVGKNLTLPVLPAGSYVITADYSGDGDFIPASDIAFFTINKAPNNAVVNVDDVTYGESTTIKVSADVDGVYPVDINGTVYNITVSNGVGNKSIALNAGSYYANATFNNKNYITKIKNAEFNVNKALNNVVIAVGDVTYGEDAVISISADVDGVYAVDVNGTVYNITVSNGVGNKSISLNAGSYYANTSFNDDNYVPKIRNAVFNVNKALNSVVIAVDDVTYGEDTIIEVSADVDGVYAVDVNGTVYNITVNNGVGNKSIALNAGTYYANTTFNNDNYMPKIKNAVFNVNKALNNVVIAVGDVTYCEDAVISISADVDGVYAVDVNGTVYNITVSNGVGNKSISLNAGSYYANTSFNDDNYVPKIRNAVFNVNKALNNVVVTADNVTYGENITINVSADVDGVYPVDINGTVYNITVGNGVGNRSIALNAGSYYANATFDNDNYNSIYRNAVFSVDKADTMLSVYVPNTVYLQDVVGVVYSSVDGEYNVTIGDYSTTVIIENVFCEFNAGILNAGDYILTVTYPGDLNHKANSTTATVYISRFAPNVSLNVSDVDWGETEVITVTSDIYGFVNVTVNNVTVTLDLDGTIKYLLASSLNAASDYEYKATLNLDNLDSGTYPVTAVYLGDDNIESIFLSGEFKVNALNATMDADAGDINVGDDETITVTLPDDATGTVTATVDGENYTAAVENGTASITIPGLTAGEKTADVYYSGDGKYNPIEGTASFTVSKIKAKMTIDANEDSQGTVTVVVNLPDDATGTVTVTVDGKDYTVAVENGKATINIKGLATGKHDISVIYSGDGKYDPIQGKSNVVVKDMDVKHENKTADNVTPDKKAIKSTDKEMLKATGNPILALLLTLMAIGIATIRRF